MQEYQIIGSFLVGFGLSLLYVLRNKHPLFRVIWQVIVLFFVALLTTLLTNYARDKVKKWWNNN